MSKHLLRYTISLYENTISYCDVQPLYIYLSNQLTKNYSQSAGILTNN